MTLYYDIDLSDRRLVKMKSRELAHHIGQMPTRYAQTISNVFKLNNVGGLDLLAALTDYAAMDPFLSNLGFSTMQAQLIRAILRTARSINGWPWVQKTTRPKTQESHATPVKNTAPCTVSDAPSAIDFVQSEPESEDSKSDQSFENIRIRKVGARRIVLDSDDSFNDSFSDCSSDDEVEHDVESEVDHEKKQAFDRVLGQLKQSISGRADDDDDNVFDISSDSLNTSDILDLFNFN